MCPDQVIQHPVGCFSQFLRHFGPHVFTLWRLSLLKKRVLMFSQPPIGEVCHRGEFPPLTHLPPSLPHSLPSLSPSSPPSLTHSLLSLPLPPSLSPSLPLPPSLSLPHLPPSPPSPHSLPPSPHSVLHVPPLRPLAPCGLGY